MPFIIECHVFHTETTSLEVGDNVIREERKLIPADKWTLYMVVWAEERYTGRVYAVGWTSRYDRPVVAPCRVCIAIACSIVRHPSEVLLVYQVNLW